MNGARTIFRRKGYLLTALAAAVLLAASSGTAWAQTPGVGFVTTSGSVDEKASVSPSTPGLLTVTVRASGLPGGAIGVDPATSEPTPRQSALTALGTISYAVTNAAGNVESQAIVASPIGNLNFNNTDEVVLTITPLAAGDPNWNNESYSIKLQSTAGAIAPNPGVFTVMVIDDEVAPVAKFDRTSVKLTEDSNTSVGVRVVTGARGVPLPVITSFTSMLGITVSPVGAVAATCPTSAAKTNALMLTGAVVTDARTGMWDVTGNISTLGVASPAAAAANLMIRACGDMSNYRGSTVTISMVAKSLENMTAGDITPGAPLVITIESDEAVPTLSFSPTDVTIDEGGSTQTVLLAEGKYGSEVGMVKLSVEGEAMVGLYQGMDKLEEMDGHVYVDLGTSNSARLTARSYSDPDLMDGDTKFIAWKLVEGGTDGTNIGDGYWFRVDVVGSTAVPALPLIGQLLLALFLMAGGARLYRRRQG